MNSRSNRCVKSKNKRLYWIKGILFGGVMAQVFHHKNFYANFDRDLRRARFLVKIQSPFMTTRRVDMLMPVLKSCIEKKVKVCVFTQKIESRYLTKEEYQEKISVFKVVVNSLSSIGVHVNTIAKIHENW